jgi:hypothetical protein
MNKVIIIICVIVNRFYIICDNIYSFLSKPKWLKPYVTPPDIMAAGFFGFVMVLWPAIGIFEILDNTFSIPIPDILFSKNTYFIALGLGLLMVFVFSYFEDRIRKRAKVGLKHKRLADRIIIFVFLFDILSLARLIFGFGK